MCGFANPLSFKHVTDAEILLVETFIRENTMKFLEQKMRDTLGDSINELCDVLVDDELLIDHFGELYANNRDSFMFHAGDVILIKELVEHVKQIVDEKGKNTGLAFFQNSKRIRKKTSKKSANPKQKVFKMLTRPTEGDSLGDNLKNELIRKITTCFSPYMTDVHKNNELMNISECVVVLNSDDGLKIYGDVTCIICKFEDRVNQKPKRVYYNKKSENKGCWVLSNIVKHLQIQHSPSVELDKNNQQQSDLTNIENKIASENDAEFNITNIQEEHYILEDNGNLSLIMVDDSELKVVENSDQDNPQILYSQLSEQVVKVMAASMKNNETCSQMEIGFSERKITVANIPGDGSCIFGALAHQLWMYKISSMEHKQATKKLRAEVVEHILKPEYFPLYKQRLRERVFSFNEKVGKKVTDTDMEMECKIFVKHVLSNKKTWGGAETLLAVSILHSTNIIVFNENGTIAKVKKADQNHNRSIAIAFRIGLNDEFNHYDSVCEINSADLYTVANKCCSHSNNVLGN